MLYEQEKYSDSVSQQPIPESSEGSKTKPNQNKTLNLKNLITNTKWSLLTVMLCLEGEKYTLPAETVRTQPLMAKLQPCQD